MLNIGDITTRTTIIGYADGRMIAALETVQVVERFNAHAVVVRILSSTDAGSRVGELGYTEG